LSILIPPPLTRTERSRREAKQATRPRLVNTIVAWARAWKFGLISVRDRRLMQVFAMVGTQRTGTNLLRELLSGNPEIAAEGEIFTPGEDGLSAFERFQREAGLGRPAAYPQAEQQFTAFLADLWRRRAGRARLYGIDIKYSQLRAVTPHFEPLCSIPMVAQFLQASGCKILHVVRENVLHAALSEAIAAGRQIWHHRDGEAIDRPVAVDCRDLVRIMQEKSLDRRIFASLMEGTGRMLTCEYERIVRGLGMVDAEGRLIGEDNPIFDIADFLGVARNFRRPPNLQQKVVQAPYREIVANYRELVDTVRRTEFAAFLETI